jgi:hypothetical protein
MKFGQAPAPTARPAFLSPPAGLAAVLAAALALSLLAPAALAQDAGSRPRAPVATEQAPLDEPAVRRSVVEDDNARIEEVNVRGAVRSTKVQPKGVIKAEYEVLQMDAGRDLTAGPSSARGAAGQSVWRVLSF